MNDTSSNRRLDPDQLREAHQLVADIRARLNALAQGDADLLFAFRRKISKELIYDERSTPAHRNRIKALKREEQKGLCAICGETLPEKYVVLDRFRAALGYTVENTRLICRECDIAAQEAKGYT